MHIASLNYGRTKSSSQVLRASTQPGGHHNVRTGGLVSGLRYNWTSNSLSMSPEGENVPPISCIQ